MLLGRSAERGAVDRLVKEIQTGRSQALVLRGEPGIGKTALLDYAQGEAVRKAQIIRVSGAEAERELPFAALHQMCIPMLGRLDRLPDPQRTALSTAFGIETGPTPDRFMMGLGVLGLLSELASKQPVLCLIDDSQWLDQASAQVIGFAARRLHAESVGMVFARRGDPADVESPNLAGLPELVVGGLADHDARALLASTTLGPIDDRVLERLIAETRGNPLALLELPRGFTPAELAGGFGLFVDPVMLPRRIEESYRRQIDGLSREARQVLLVAAAEPTGDPVLVWRAVDRLGIDTGMDVSMSLKAAGLVDFDARVRFRHPLLRSAVYRTATPVEQHDVHIALAEVTDPETDPDRRAWQRAHAAATSDEEIAAELEQSARRAQARGGPAAAAAFLERAAELTPDPTRRGYRLLQAAHAKHEAGMPDAGLRLAAMADASPLDELAHARVDLLRAHIMFTINRGRDSTSLLLNAARRLEPLDPALARTTYLEAMRAAWYAADSRRGATLRDVGKAAASVTTTALPARPADLLLDGFVVRHTTSFAASVPLLKSAVQAFLDPGLPPAEAMQWSWFACATAVDLFDDAGADALATAYVSLARRTGTVSALPMALTELIVVRIYEGDLDEADTLIAEMQEVADSTGAHGPAYTSQLLAAWAGQEGTATKLIATSTNDAKRRGEGLGRITGGWAEAILCNSLGRYEDALGAARQAATTQEMGILTWAPLVEFIVAAGHTAQHRDDAMDALGKLSAMTHAADTDWALGTEALCRAFLSEPAAAQRDHLEAIERLSRTRVRTLLARAHLYFGEFLWRHDRRAEARDQLRVAYDLCTTLGMNGFAALAASRLEGISRKQPDDASGPLTAQEKQIARLATDGMTNVEIAGRLFISPRTVEWHLGKIFSKLGITSRRQLRRQAPVPLLRNASP